MLRRVGGADGGRGVGSAADEKEPDDVFGTCRECLNYCAECYRHCPDLPANGQKHHAVCLGCAEPCGPTAKLVVCQQA